MNADKRLGFNTDYETVAASQTDQVIGSTGAAGDLLEQLIVSVATSATGTVSIKDGASGSSIVITAANTPIGVYSVNIGAKSNSGGWRVTTGAGATAIAVGRFT
jgi:hypothetical protein